MRQEMPFFRPGLISRTLPSPASASPQTPHERAKIPTPPIRCVQPVAPPERRPIRLGAWLEACEGDIAVAFVPGCIPIRSRTGLLENRTFHRVSSRPVVFPLSFVLTCAQEQLAAVLGVEQHRVVPLSEAPEDPPSTLPKFTLHQPHHARNRSLAAVPSS